ncbi:MAG: hypothetical protein AAF926_05975 [Pseudomonadota bacterium]
MSGPSIDLEEKNPLGGLDRLATGIGLAIIAVFPTLAAAIFMPWKLAPLLVADEPSGRRGMVLAPGAYFVLSLVVILIFVGALVTPEMVRSNGGVIGPGLAFQVSEAAQQGDVWKTLSRIAPIFLIALLFGLIGRTLTRWAGDWWDLRVSLRASFYAIATSICWIIFSSLVIDSFKLFTGSHDLAQTLYAFNSVPILSLPAWVYFWCFRTGGSLSTLRAFTLTIAIFAMVLLFVIASGLLFARF